MHKFFKPVLTGIAIAAFAASGSAVAFSFSESFNDSWSSGKSGSSWSTPNWGTTYNTPSWGPWSSGPRYYPRPGTYYHPRISPYDRNMMRQKRQALMSNHDDAMDGLADMLFGKFKFNRDEAIALAREIEMNANQNMLKNFHPGAVATHDSNTAPTYWGNEEAFKSYVDALRVAARNLALELGKRPKDGEGVMYPRQSKGFEYRRSYGNDADPISSEVFTKFNEVAATCQTCHSYFRIPGW